MAWLIPPSSPSLPSLHYSTPFPTCSSTGGCLRWYGRLLFFSCGFARKGRIWRSVWWSSSQIFLNGRSVPRSHVLYLTVQYHPCTLQYYPCSFRMTSIMLKFFVFLIIRGGSVPGRPGGRVRAMHFSRWSDDRSRVVINKNPQPICGKSKKSDNLVADLKKSRFICAPACRHLLVSKILAVEENLLNCKSLVTNQV